MDATEAAGGWVMDTWHYEPYADWNPAAFERFHALAGAPDVLIRGLRCLSAGVLRCWLRVYHRLTIVGRENLPADRSFVLIANHASHLDTLCLLAALPFGALHRTYPLAARDYFCRSTLRALAAGVVVNALPFDRNLAPWESLDVCARMLDEPGTILIFFPEGTRSGDAEPSEFKPGVALLTAGRDIPVVPCHLAGTHAALPKGAWCPRPRKIRLMIGAPRFYTDRPATKQSAREIAQELRDAVIDLGRVQSTTETEAVGALL